jgi:serine/threonine protein kinase
VRNRLRQAASDASDKTAVSGALIDGYRVERVSRTRSDACVVLEATAPDGERVMLTLITADGEQRRHALRLARLRASIDHPNLLPFHGVRESRDRIYAVSAVAGPRTLSDQLGTGPLDAGEAMRLLGQVASALEAAAQHGLLHRDLAPDAIALTRERPARAVLTDLGIATPPASGCELLSVGEGADYRSPEEVRGEPLVPESNVYSLACILVECLTATPPYPYARPLLTLHAHVVEPPPRVSERNPDLPTAIDAVVAKGMAKDPGERYDSPTTLIRAAGKALGTEPDIPVVPAPKKERRPVPARPTVHRRRPRARLATVGIALALFASVVSGFAAGSVDWSGDDRRSKGSRSPSPQHADRVTQAAYVNDVAGAVDRLRTRRALARRRLRAAHRPAGQAAAATAVARAYRQAGREMPRPRAGAGGEPGLLADLRRAERAYRKLAAAARRRNGRDWRAARRETLRRERALEGRLREVRLS